MAQLALYLLGLPRVELDGVPLQMERRKAVALLIYLALNPQAQSRDVLATLFWPEYDQKTARGNLRRTLSTLNQTLGKSWLEVERDSVTFPQSDEVWVDVSHLHRLLVSCATHGHPPHEVCPACLSPLGEAVTLYRDDFLTGFTLPDSPNFDDWRLFQAEALRQELAEALEALAQGHAGQGEYKPALAYARRRLALDPLHEPAHRHLMQLYAQAGQQAAALRQYQLCLETLKTELGVSPAPETTVLYEQIRAGKLVPGEQLAPVPVTPTSTVLISRRYEIPDLEANLIGQGSMGRVYRGRDIQTNETVAIKLLKPDYVATDPAMVERFAREGETLRQLNHPNIVKLLAAVEEGSHHYLIIEYVGGGSLRELLKQQAPLPLSRVLQIALELSDALAQTHHRQIIHRDLKPGNVLLDDAGHPRLTDFGIAHLAGRPRLTETGLVLGTVDYLSPEACNGEKLDGRADIWAFGVLLYEMLSGERHFRGDNLAATMAAILTRPTPNLAELRPDLPATLVGLISQMLEKERDRRIASVRLVGAALESIARGDDLSTPDLRQASPPLPPHASARRPPHHNLPTQTTSFIGREAELAEIKHLLLDEPACRLLTLLGPGGTGKTRLALVAAGQTLDTFPDGVYFVSLAPVSQVEYIVPAIAEALRFTFYGSTDPKAQLLDYLSQKRLLLIVDNFEHLLEGANLLSDILSVAPGVTLLVTSRERLHLQEEWVYQVQGLPFPASGGQTSEVSETPEALASYSAIQLFLQRARQVEASFTPSATEVVDIGRICQLVEGMPLGLELAAPWIRTLSCREIGAEIKHSLDFLTTTLRNVPERHRSLRVVFEQTWGRLSPAEQSVLSQLSVFRGGCTREAAEQVTGATLTVLSSLVDKALLRRTNLGRYELHELIRQFAETQLQTEPKAVDQVQQRHRDFFITFLEVRTVDVKRRRQLEALAEIEADIDNVRLAWRGAVANREAEAIERSAECLFVYYLYRNGYDEGQTEFGRAISAFAALPDRLVDDGWLQELVIPDEKKNLAGFLLAGLGYFIAHRRNLPKGQLLLEQALALLRRTTPRDQRKEAFALLWLGWSFYFQGQFIEGKQYARESLALLTETADHWGEGWALLLLGGCLRDGRPAEAETIYQTGLTLCRESGDQIVLSYLSQNMGTVATELGRYAQARQHTDLAVTISEKLDNILGLGYSLFSRGRLEISQGQYRPAITTLQQALTYFNKVGTVHASRAQIYLGLAHHLQGDHSLAAQLYGQALEGFKAANSKLELTRCLNFLGYLAYDQGKLHQAEQFQQESLALLQETEPEPALVAATLYYLGQVMLASGEHRQAEDRDYFWQALELAMEHLLAPIALDVCIEVARLRVQAGKTEQAVELLVLAEQHEASTFETQKKARQHLAKLLEPLPSEVRQAAQARGWGLDWQQMAKRLIDELQEQAVQSLQSTRRI